jgi:uncharacterized protein (DUF2062 family)
MYVHHEIRLVFRVTLSMAHAPSWAKGTAVGLRVSWTPAVGSQAVICSVARHSM